MKIITGCRRSGKTYKLLKQLDINDLYVGICEELCEEAKKDWKSLHKDAVGEPIFITHEELLNGKYSDLTFNNVFIDELSFLMEFILNKYHIPGKIITSAFVTTEELPVPESVINEIKKSGGNGFFPHD